MLAVFDGSEPAQADAERLAARAGKGRLRPQQGRPAQGGGCSGAGGLRRVVSLSAYG